MLTDALQFLLDAVFKLFVYALLLRFYMQVFRAPFRNPLGQFVVAFTDFLVKPARRVIPGVSGVDWATLLLAWVAQALLVSLSFALRGTIFSASVPMLLAAVSLIELLKASIYLLMVAVFVQAILSWVAPYGPLAPVLGALTTPFLNPIRRHLPLLGGQIDLSPLIVFVLGQLVIMLPIAWLEQAVVQIAR
jgi:YggT family protein